MLSTIIGVSAVFGAILFSRPITTFVHEMGHALPALLFTDKEVIVYIGSYGDTSNSSTFQLGRLQIIFKYHLINWQLGLCQHSSAVVIWKSLVIILGGPVFSLLLGLFFVVVALQFKDHQYIAFGAGIFLVSGLVDFFANIIPDSNPLNMHDGSLTYNDGSQFLMTLKSTSYPNVYFEGLEEISKENYPLAIDKLSRTIESGVSDLPVYRLVLHLFELQKNQSGAIQFQEAYTDRFKLAPTDHVYIGKIYESQGNKLKAISHYGLAIEKNYLYPEALFLRGKLLLELGYQERGIKDLNRVLLMDVGNIEAKELLNN